MAYCEVADVQRQLGQISLPPSITVDDYINDAADKVDAALSSRYVVPVPIVVGEANDRQAASVLRRLNADFAAGWIILAAAGPGSSDRVQAYGKYLLDGAQRALDALSAGTVVLDNQPASETHNLRSAGPKVVGVDRYSLVDQFYQNEYPEGFMPGPLRLPTISEENKWPA